MTAGKRLKRLARERARRTGESYVSARRNLLRVRSEDVVSSKQDDKLVEMVLDGVQVAADVAGQLYLDFREKEGGRQLPVYIGAPEAFSIRFAIEGGGSARPMTHDALQQLVEALGGHLRRIVIGLVVDASTYTADVTIALPDGTERHFDWRVSDAVALAVRCDPWPTILVPEAVLTTPRPKLGGIYSLRCSCGTPVRFKGWGAPARPRQARAFHRRGRCPSCGRQVKANLAPPPT